MQLISESSLDKAEGWKLPLGETVDLLVTKSVTQKAPRVAALLSNLSYEKGTVVHWDPEGMKLG
jgi:hypothetical protein